MNVGERHTYPSSSQPRTRVGRVNEINKSNAAATRFSKIPVQIDAAGFAEERHGQNARKGMQEWPRIPLLLNLGKFAGELSDRADRRPAPVFDAPDFGR